MKSENYTDRIIALLSQDSSSGVPKLIQIHDASSGEATLSFIDAVKKILGDPTQPPHVLSSLVDFSLILKLFQLDLVVSNLKQTPAYRNRDVRRAVDTYCLYRETSQAVQNVRPSLSTLFTGQIPAPAAPL